MPESDRCQSRGMGIFKGCINKFQNETYNFEKLKLLRISG
jgi:hypothetical protein